MSEQNLPSGQPPDNSGPTTAPVLTPPPAPQPPSTPMGPPPVRAGHPSRLTRAAAWVGIVAGSLFIVVVIFGSGFFLGTQVGDDGGPRGHHRGGPELLMRPGPGMPPMGPRGEFERRPAFAGPFGPGGPLIELPRPPDPTTAPARP